MLCICAIIQWIGSTKTSRSIRMFPCLTQFTVVTISLSRIENLNLSAEILWGIHFTREILRTQCSKPKQSRRKRNQKTKPDYQIEIKYQRTKHKGELQKKGLLYLTIVQKRRGRKTYQQISLIYQIMKSWRPGKNLFLHWVTCTPTPLPLLQGQTSVVLMILPFSATTPFFIRKWQYEFLNSQ